MSQQRNSSTHDITQRRALKEDNIRLNEQISELRAKLREEKDKRTLTAKTRTQKHEKLTERFEKEMLNY